MSKLKLPRIDKDGGTVHKPVDIIFTNVREMT